ncbi:Proteasome subunit alpha type-2 [Irineochytrium annulatum]|nr:Proteasome subunit alpha type-2 [Irineochytrium annulatum]
MSDRYSFSLTTFSPSGKLVQIEHALSAVGRGITAVGIKGSNGVVIATEKKLPSPLVDDSTVERVYTICRNIGVVYSGIGPDARVLVDKARKSAQEYKRVYMEEPPTTILVKEIASIMQEFTQSGGVRPFGVSLLVAGFDDHGPSLYQVDPSGSYFAWKASAIGKNMVNAKTFLEKRYTDNLELEDAVHTAILTLKESYEGVMNESTIEIGVSYMADTTTMHGEKIKQGMFRKLPEVEIKDYLANARDPLILADCLKRIANAVANFKGRRGAATRNTSSRQDSAADDTALARHLSDILPQFAVELFFSVELPQARSLTVSVLTRLHDVLPEPRPLPAVFASALDAFLESNLVDADAATTMDVTRLCSILYMSLDWSPGAQACLISGEGSERRVGIIVERLTDLLTRSIAEEDAAPTAYVSEALTRERYDLLRTLVAYVSKLGDRVADDGALSRSLRRAGDAGWQLLFPKRGYVNSDASGELLMIAGILIAWVVRHGCAGEGRGVVSGVLDGAIGAIPTNVREGWKTSELSDISILALCNGLLSTLRPVDAFFVGTETGPTPLALLYERITLITDRVSAPETKVMGFRCLAGLLGVMRDLMEKGPMHATTKELDKAELVKRSFSYVYAFWEDPLDSMQYKVGSGSHPLLGKLTHRSSEISSILF